MSTIIYNPCGVCCRQMELEVEGDTLKSVVFHGGCNGNLQGVSRLVAGQNIETLAAMLQGIDCKGKGTSCPDQLSKALLSIKEQK